MMQRAELLERLRLLERRRGQRGEAQQRLPPVGVQPDVLAGEARARRRLRRSRAAAGPRCRARTGSGCARSTARRRARRSPPSRRPRRASPPRRSRGSDTVDIGSPGSASRGATAPSMKAGSSMGSSPCTFTTISASVAAAASASRSVPVACAREVIATSPPNARTAVRDALVVGGHQHAVHRPRQPRALPDVLDHRLAVDLGERLSGKACGTEPCGDDRDDGQIGWGPRVRRIVAGLGQGSQPAARD